MSATASDFFIASNTESGLRMLDVLRRALPLAAQVDIAVSFVRCSGLSLIIDDLRRFVARGGKARILTSTYLSVTQPEALSTFRALEGVECRIFHSHDQGFHMKLYAFWGGAEECWVGSSNLSKGGLTDNLELNLCHRDPNALRQVQHEIEALWNGAEVIPLSRFSLDEYTRAFGSAYQKRIVAESAPDHHTPPTPNEAQREALARLAALRQGGERRAVVIAAPGVGKTYLAAFDAKAQGARSVLFVSHRLEHLRQAQDTFASLFGVENTGLLDGENRETGKPFLFASIQTLNRTGGLYARHFDYLVIDEMHHAAAKSYESLHQKMKPGFLLGLTATPERQDGHDVLKICDYNIAYEARLVAAINRGWLLPFHYFAVADELVDYEKIPWRSGRFDPTSLEKLLQEVEKRIQLTLEKDYRLRHGGILNTPAGLRLFSRYERYEIINHFGLQYDPSRHNTGVITFKPSEPCPDDIVIITKLDTSSAKEAFQYQNRFLDPETLSWQSQNRNRQNTEPGKFFVDPDRYGKRLHVFVQESSHAKAVYLGQVRPVRAEGQEPINLVFRLATAVPQTLWKLFAIKGKG